MKTQKHLFSLIALALVVVGGPRPGQAATFGWSGSGTGPGSGVNTAWLTVGNWTNNASLPGSLDLALFGSAGSGTAIGFNFNGPPAAGSTNIGALVLGTGSTVDRSLGNSSTTAGIATYMYYSGIGGGLISNLVSGRTLTLAPFSGGSGNAMTNILLANGNIHAVGTINIAGVLGEAGGARNITKSGIGALILNTNTFTGTLTVNQDGLVLLTGPGSMSGTTLNTTSILRVAHSAALGSGNLTVNPNNAETGRLELSNNVSILSGKILTLSARANTTDAIRNVGGNNTIAGSISFTTGGSTYAIDSASGTLTLSGGVTSTATGGRTLTLQGGSSGTVSAPIVNGSAVMGLTKGGTGAWTLTAANTLTGPVNVTGGSLVLTGNGAISNSPLITVNSGTTLNASAIPGGFNVMPNQTFSGSGLVLGPVTFAEGSRLIPGGLFAAGTMTFGNTVAINTTNTLNFDLAATPIINTGSNDLLVVNGDLNVTVPVPITFAFPLGQPQLGVPYTLIRYSGVLSGAGNLSIAGISSPSATLDTSVPGLVTVTFSAAAPNNIVWTGTNGFNWNLASTVNFSNAAGAEVTFSQGDNVLFDDSSTNQAVTLADNNLQPSAVTVNSSSNFTFAGSGSLAGGTITKAGTGTLAVNTANSTPGAISILGGTLRTGNAAALGNAAGATTISGGGTLDVNGQNLGQESVVVSGAGVGGLGAILNSGGQQINAIKFLTLTADTTFGGVGRWDMRANSGNALLSSGGQPFKITKVGPNVVGLVDTVVDPALGDIDVQAGTFTTESFTQLGDPTKTMTIWSNAIFRLWANTVPLNKLMVMSNTAKFFVENGTANAFNGPITLVEGTNFFDINVSSALSVTGNISGAAALIKTNTGTLSLFGTNTYTGVTFITNGLLQGTTLSIPGAVTNNAGLVLNQNFDGTLVGPVVGVGGTFIKRGLGRVTITTPMGITGTVTNEAGTIVLGADNVLGTGPLDWRGAGGLFPAFESSDASTRTLANALIISTDARLGSATSGDLIFSGPANNGGGQKILTVSNAMTTFSSGFGNLGVVVKGGPGQMVLGGANNNSGIVISNGIVALAVGGYFSNNPSMTIIGGAVLDVSAGSGGTFTNISGKALIAGRTSGFANDIIGSLQSTGTITVGAALFPTPATMTVSGGALIGGGTLNFDLASTTTTGAGVNDFINFTGGAVTLAGTITVNVTLLNGSLANGTYTLISGTAPVVGAPTFTLTGTNGSTRQTASVAISGNDVVLIVAGTPIAGALTWLGTNVNWDLTTTNWWSGSITDRFFNNDTVLFDDTSANTNVQITATLSPMSVTVNSSSNYTFAGAGLIAGGASIAKSGSGILTLGGANTYFGPVSITGGTLKQSAAGALGNSSGVSATGGGQIDFAGFTTTSRALSFSLAGTGPDARGAMINSGTSVSGSAISNVTLTADATIGAHGTDSPNFGRMDIGVGYGLLNGNGNTLTKIGPGYLNIRSTTINLPELVVSGGTLYTENIDNNLGAKVTVLNGARLGGTGARLYTNTVHLLAGSTFFTAVGNSFSTWAGPINVLGQSAFGAATIAAGAGAQDLRIVGPFHGSGNIVLSVAPLEFTGHNDATYSGNISVNGTTLRLTTNGTHGSGVITNNNGTVEFNVFHNVAYNRNIYGPAGTVRKANTNLFQLTGASGDQISDALVLDVTGGVFDLNGRSEAVRGLTGSLGTLVTNSGGSLVSLVLTNPNANPHIYNGSIAGPITVVVRDSAARNGVLQSFTGTNTFTGGLIIDNGQLRASGDWVLGVVPPTYDPANIIFRNNGAIQNNASTLFLHPNRGILLQGDVTFMPGFSTGNDIVVNGSITGPGRVLKGDGQRLILKNVNTFTGDTVFTNVAGVGLGTIRLDHTLALQNSTFDATGLGGNGTLDLNNMDVVVGMLKGSGATIANFNGRLTAGGNGQNGVFGSTLSGAGSLVKVGSGILTLTAVNPFNGGTIVSNGTLLALGNLTGFGPLVVKSGAMFGSPAIVSGPVTVEAGGSVYPGASVGTLSVSNHLSINSGSLFYELASVHNTGGGINDLINVQSNLTLSGSTLVRFSFVNGAPALGVPYVLMSYAGTLTGGAGNLTSDSRYTATFDHSVAGQIRVTFSGAGVSILVWTGSTTNNTWNLGTFTNFYNGLSLDTFKDADSVTFDDSGYAGAPVNLEGLLSPTLLTINAAQDYTFAGAGHLNMAGNLAKLGAGKLTLANTNDFIGRFTVSGGTLSVGLDEFLGVPPPAAVNQILLPGGTFQVTGSFTLNSNRRIAVGPTNSAGAGVIEVIGTNVLSYAGVIGNNQFGIGTLVKRGTGRLSLQNANTYSGGTMLSQGTLSIRNANALGTLGPITVGDASSGADDLTLLLETSAGNLTLTRDINVSSLGSGVVTLGSTALPLAPGGNNMSFSGNIALTNRDLALRSGGGNVTFFSGDILGTGNLIITNGSLTGDVGGGQAGNRVIWDNLPKSFTGDITILSGNLSPIYSNYTVFQINTPHIIRDTASVTVQTNAIFRLNADENIDGLTGLGRVRGVVSPRALGVGANNSSSIFNGVMENDPVNGGSLAVTKLGSGVLTLNGANTYTGGTIVGGSGSLALGASGSLSNSTSLIVSNGATFDVSAVSGGYVLMGNQTLNGYGTVAGNTTLASNATVNPGLLHAVGTLSVSGDLGVNNSNRFNFELGSVPAGPGNDQLVVSGNLNISGLSYITVNAATPLAAGTYTLITCSGTKSSAGGAANFVLINNTASAMSLGENANAITLTVTTPGRSFVWAANFTNSLWDINITTNWLNGGVLGGFLAGDAVLFDSTASNQNVTVSATLLPSTVTLTGGTNYSFTGAGRFSGPASITQNSTATNTITLTGGNDYAGNVTINGGVLRTGNGAALGSIFGSTIVNPGGTLDVGGQNLGAEPITASGAGFAGLGAIVNFGADQINATRFVTLAGDATFGGTGRWDIRANPTAALSSGGNPYKITKVGSGQFVLVSAVVDPALGDIDVLGGLFSVEVATTGAGDPTRSINLAPGTTLQMFQLATPLNKQISMTNGSRIFNNNGVNTLVGPISLLGSNAFEAGGTTLNVSNTVSGPGTLWKLGGNTLVLAGNNTHSGGNVLVGGTTILTGNNPNSGGYSNAATLQVGNLGSSGSISGLITNNGTINLQRADATTFTAGVLGLGTINQVSGSGPVTFSGNITNANLNVRSGNNSILTLGAGPYSLTNLTVGNTPSGWMNILPGATVGIPNTYFVGDASGGQTGVVVQTGGDIIVGNQFRLSHWGNNVSTYLLAGGSLSLTTTSAGSPYSAGVAEVNGGFYIGIDGVGLFTQTNGTLNVPGIVMDNRGATTLGINTNTYDLQGGTLNLGRWGFLTANSTYQIRLGGGLITSSESWTSALTMTLTGTNGDITVSPSAGQTNQFGGALAGLGGMIKSGAGEVVLASGGNTFAGPLNITAGAVQAPAQFSGTGSSLGLRSGSRTVTVGSTATLLMTINNVLTGSGNSAANLPTITVNGGTLDSTRYNALGHLNLNGGLLSQTSSDGPGAYEGYQFLGHITVGGSVASTINSGNGRGNHLLGDGTNIFNVADVTGDSAADLTVSNPLLNSSADYPGAGSLRKIGAGKLQLTGASSYTGITYVEDGTLQVDGSLGATTVLVNGGTLAGNGSIGGPVSVAAAGTLAPGASIGTLTINGTLTLSGNTDMEIDKTAGVLTNDFVTGVTVLTYGGTLTITATGDPLAAGDTFNLFDAGTFTGSFSAFNLPALPPALAWDTSQLGVDGTIRVVERTAITSNPANQTVECATGTAMFSVVATGTAPLSYQWQSNGVAVAGGTAATLSFGGLNLASSGNFDVVVANGGSSITSLVATLATQDTTPPVPSCSTNIIAECTSSNGAIVTFIATAADACDPAPTMVCTPISGSTFPLGTNVVTCVATDLTGNTNACNFTIAVLDSAPPTIVTCATSRSFSADTNCQASIPDLTTEIVALDLCGSVTVTQSPAAGTLVGFGATNVTLTVTDPASNTVTCVAIITVFDDTPPSITCPSDVMVQCATNVPAANFAGGTATDYCNPAPVVTHVGDVSVGSNPTIITRTYRATDASGNTNDCTQMISVQDTTPPVITMCAPDATLTADMNGMALIPNLAAQVVASDNCSGVTITQDPTAGTSVGASNTPVVLTVTDAVANSITCTTIVSVVVNVVPPILSTQPVDTTVECTSNATFSVTANGTAPLSYYWYFGTNLVLGPTSNSLTITATLATVGDYSVVVSNVAGTATSTNAALRVVDTQPPLITCPAATNVQCLANVPAPIFAGGSVLDGCDPMPMITHVSDVTNGICPATVTRIYRATDASNNMATCTQIITVQDTVPPTINCGQNETLQCGLSWGFTVPNIGDNCDPAPTLSILSTTTNAGCGITFTATRVWQVEDFCGNITTCTQVVTIIDTLPPTITQCPGPLPFQCLSQVPAPDTALVLATDSCNAVTVTWAGDVTNGTCPTLITRTYRATDACSNSTPCVQIITVHDTTPPMITCPAATNVQCNADVPAMNILSVIATDNCDPAPVVTHISDVASGSCPTTIVRTYRATDTCGNTNDCAQIITVHDTVPPVATCPGSFSLKTVSPLGTNVSYSASATDNCGTLTPVCTPASGMVFSVGATVVTCVATDGCGNTNACAFTVTVLLADQASRTVNLPVPDGTSVGLASVLNVASPIGSLTDVNVTLNISNGWNGDLYAYLVHSSGFSILLNRTGKRASDPLGYTDAGFNITLDDQAANNIHSYRLHVTGSHTVPLVGPLTGSWQPDGRLIDPAAVLDTDTPTEFLSSFNGLNPNGEWVLYVGDEATGDISTLVSWSLELCGDAGVAPAITGQPQGETVSCGTPVTLSVTNTGSAPIGYHWLSNGVPVPGANGDSLLIASARNRLPVAYSVIVSNAFGSVASTVATVTVLDVAPVIDTQPADRTNIVGTTATFTLALTSCSDVAVQWCKGATPIPGATSATLSLANVQLSDAGSYVAKITNAGGSATSAAATLTVNRLPIALPNGGATIEGQPLPISFIKLLYNDSDPDGDPITIVSATASTNGGSVDLAGGYATYNPVPGFTGVDRYSYTISDGRGGTATTNVEIMVVSKDLPSANKVVIIPVGAGYLIRFAGIPGKIYNLQRAPAVNGPWTTLTTVPAPLHGIIEYLDANPPVGAGFYRTTSL